MTNDPNVTTTDPVGTTTDDTCATTTSDVADGVGGAEGDGWESLDRRTVVVTAILMSGVAIGAAVPTVAGISSGTSMSVALAWVVPAGLLVIAASAAADYLRWRKTRYRIGRERAELHSGILLIRRRSLARERIRSVDLTANPLLRIFGLVAVKIGTGEKTEAGESTLTLNPLTRHTGEQLRRELLIREPNGPSGQSGPSDPNPKEEGTLARLDPAWIQYAPISFLVPALGLGAGGVVMQVAQWFNAQAAVVGWVGDRFEGVGLVPMILILLAIAMIVGVIASLALFVELWWNYRLDREHGTLRVTRGLTTTRSISIEERRLRGVDVVEPLGVRLAGAARVDAVATGMTQKKDDDKTDHKTLLPAAPKAIADRLAADVLREEVSPTEAARLIGHPRAAYGRRLRWAYGSAAAFIAVLLILGLWLTPVFLHLAWIAAVVLAPTAFLLARDAYRSLGHALSGDYLVARSGTVRRSTVALQRDGVIGWTIKQSVFQRRAGLLTLTATTAAGPGGYSVYDAAAGEGLLFAREAVPELLEPFLRE
ncbi:PH domain-containing protein [Kribbella sp. NBC_01245]|uniref:PH domain-containing protein n=1 Tax=Kribbella sp. NBC_01245 TaxID=2903578 RepID=UPI002E2AAC0D|nr:PH domain-containing protein [Kribbella sp. NBC_01245]